MKNKILTIIFLLGLVGLFSCQPEEFELANVSDIFITWSPLTVNVNNEVSLADGSRGVKSRLWTFPGNGLVDILGSSDDEVSTERIVFAVFKQPGVFPVRLQADFNNPNVVLDSIITVTVLDNVSAKFVSDAQTQDGILVVEVGDVINYTSVSTGSPAFYAWTFDGGTPEKVTKSTAVVKYEYLGSWDVTLIAYRNSPRGSDTLTIKDYIKVIPSSKGVGR